MKSKKLKTGRSILMPGFARRLKSFRLQEVAIENPYTFHLGILGYVEQLNRLSHLIDRSALEKKALTTGAS